MNQHTKHKIHKLCSVLIILISALCMTVSASSPYNDYTYNAYDQSIPTQAGYLPEKLITGDNLGIGSFKNPRDVY